MKIMPGQGKRRIEMSGDTHDLVLDIGKVLDPSIASTHKDYGLLDSKLEVQMGTLANIKLYFKTVNHTLAAAATSAVTDFFPADSVVWFASSRVITTITGATTWDFGYEGDDDAFGSALTLTAGDTSNLSDWVLTCPVIMPSEQNLLFTANGSNFTAGAVRVFVAYSILTAPSE